MKYLIYLMLLIWGYYPNLFQVDDKSEIFITVTNIRSNQGTVRIGVFTDNESFQNESSEILIYVDKSEMIDGKVTKSIFLPSGKYGLSMIDDENDNFKMDYNWFGIPLEGYGFSDYEHKGFFKPNYESFEIDVKSGQINQTSMKMKYLL